MIAFKKQLAASALIVALTLSSCTLALASDNITMSIKNGDIRDVLTALSNLGGQSIVTDETVKGPISIDLEDVSFTDALDLITRVKGLAYRNMHGVIVVSSLDNINKTYGQVAVYKLNYAKAEDIKTTLTSIIKGDALGVDAITNSLVFTGSSSEEAKLRDALKVLDVATKQVTLEAKIISLNATDSKQFGVFWEWGKLPGNTGEDNGYGGIIHIGHGYETQFQATLNALFNNGKAKILATPRIITIPGKEASIFIGDHIPVQTEKRDNGTTTTSTEYVDAGIKLSYTPIVSEDGVYITSVVHTEVSTPTLVPEIKNYKITSRTADTNVRMRNGETLVIGGLINEEEQKNIQKIPFLSNIPILGELFKNRTNSKTKTEVMMILTPHITEAGYSPAIYDPNVMNFTMEEQAKAKSSTTTDTTTKPSMRARAEALLERKLP
ncbi:MAG: secretin N-terminal domain-containing protein [Acidaminococcaceae bacterium]